MSGGPGPPMASPVPPRICERSARRRCSIRVAATSARPALEPMKSSAASPITATGSVIATRSPKDSTVPGQKRRIARPATSVARNLGYGRSNRERKDSMADPVPAGSDVSSGTYKCTNCGYDLQVGSTKNLPPCPSCHNGQYETVTGGDSRDDPYPDRK